MKKLILLYTWLFSFQIAISNDIPGAKNATCSTDEFFNPDKKYAPYFFWFWDRPIDDPKTQKQIRDMARAMLDNGFSPGYVHARFNMVGEADLPFEQWLSNDWFTAYKGVLAEVNHDEAAMGFVNEYWWPSGRAAGRVLEHNPDLFAESLYWETIDVTGRSTIEIKEAFFVVAAKRQVAIDNPPSESGRLDYKNSDSDCGPRTAISDERNIDNGIPIPHTPAMISSESLQLISTGESIVWTAPEDADWRIYIFKKYFHPGCDGGRINYLNARLADEFLRYAHQPYLEKVGNEFGHSISGVFIDHEGDYGYKLAWSDDLSTHYRAKNNRDIRLWMPLLFDRDIEGKYVKARWDWFESVSDIYVNFFKAVNQWCTDHNLYAISNLWEESLMWQAGAVGDFFKAQRAFSMPGTDALGLRVLEPHDFMETKSVCEFEGRRFQSEIMGGAGYWGFDNIQIKKAANAATAWGVCHVVPHAVWLTRNLEGNPWLPDWFDQNPWWPQLHVWADFVRRASYVNSCGHSAADVLLLNPMDSVWGLCGPGVFDPAYKGRVSGPALQPLQTPDDVFQTPAEVKEQSAWWCPPKMDEWFSPEVHHINDIYSQAINDLVDYRIEFLIADRHYMRQMAVDGRSLVRPPFRFKSVILPAFEIVPRDVLSLINNFAANGGRVYVLDSWPSGSTDFGLYDDQIDSLVAVLKSNPNVVFCNSSLVPELQKKAPELHAQFDFVSGRFDLLQQHRRIDGVDYYWLANNTGKTQNCTIRFKADQVLNGFSKWDCESGDKTSVKSFIRNASILVDLSFAPYEGFWLVRDCADSPQMSNPKKWQRIDLNISWTVRIDSSLQPPTLTPQRIPTKYYQNQKVELADWQEWDLAQFSGVLSYEGTFEVDENFDQARIDLGDVYAGASVWVNDTDIGDKLWPPYILNSKGTVHKGQNSIRVHVGNLRNNSTGDIRPSGLIGPVSLLYLK